MTDGQLLYLCLAGFYLLECLHWLPPGCLSFRAWRPGGRWALGKSKLEFTLAGFQPHVGPLLPASGFFVAMEWPLMLETDGVRIGRSQSGAGSFIPWEDLDLRTEERRLWLNEGRSVSFVTSAEALSMAPLLLKLRKAKPASRQSLIDAWWRTTTHPARARHALRLRQLIQRELGFSSWLIFVHCFAVIPVVYWFVGWKGLAMPMAAAMLLVLQLDVTFRRFCIEKKILKRPAGPRWLEAIQTFLLPVHAMKAAENIGARLGSGIHPATMATVLLPRRSARACVGHFWRGWNFTSATDSFRATADAWLPGISTWVEHLGWRKEELETPLPGMTGDERFCPRCHSWYGASGRLCQDCGGIETVPANR